MPVKILWGSLIRIRPVTYYISRGGSKSKHRKKKFGCTNGSPMVHQWFTNGSPMVDHFSWLFRDFFSKMSRPGKPTKFLRGSLIRIRSVTYYISRGGSKSKYRKKKFGCTNGSPMVHQWFTNGSPMVNHFSWLFRDFFLKMSRTIKPTKFLRGSLIRIRPVTYYISRGGSKSKHRKKKFGCTNGSPMVHQWFTNGSPMVGHFLRLFRDLFSKKSRTIRDNATLWGSLIRVWYGTYYTLIRNCQSKHRKKKFGCTNGSPMVHQWFTNGSPMVHQCFAHFTFLRYFFKVLFLTFFLHFFLLFVAAILFSVSLKFNLI